MSLSSLTDGESVMLSTTFGFRSNFREDRETPHRSPCRGVHLKCQCEGEAESRFPTDMRLSEFCLVDILDTNNKQVIRWLQTFRIFRSGWQKRMGAFHVLDAHLRVTRNSLARLSLTFPKSCRRFNGCASNLSLVIRTLHYRAWHMDRA